MEYLSVISPNAAKYGPEKTPYLDNFHAVQVESILHGSSQSSKGKDFLFLFKQYLSLLIRKFSIQVTLKSLLLVVRKVKVFCIKTAIHVICLTNALNNF